MFFFRFFSMQSTVTDFCRIASPQYRSLESIFMIMPLLKLMALPGISYLLHECLLYAFSESKPAKEFHGHFVLFIDLDGLHNFQKELLIECFKGFFQLEDEHL